MITSGNRNKKNVIIFGSTGYIGSLISKEISKFNINLILHGKNRKKLESLHDEISNESLKPSLLMLDVEKKNDFLNLQSIILQRFKKIDIMINSIGLIDKICPLTDLDDNEWDKLIEVNLSSNWRILKKLEPLMINSEHPRIIFFNDLKISKGHPYYHAYAIAKSGLKAMVKIYSSEKKKFNFYIKIIDIQQSSVGVYKKIYSKENKDLQIKRKIKEVTKSFFV